MLALGVAGLNFFLGVALFLFSVVSPFLKLGISFWKWGPKLANRCWDYWSHLVFYFQESFHLFDNGGVWVEFQWSKVVHLIIWIVLSLLKMCVPCIDVTLTSMSTTSTGSLHLKNPCRKLHSG